jgi:hypothetical protein
MNPDRDVAITWLGQVAFYLRTAAIEGLQILEMNPGEALK